MRNCYFNCGYGDLRELQRHCRIEHGITKQNFDYRSIGPPQHKADIQPLRKAQVSRQNREAREKKKRAALQTMQPGNTTQTPQVALPALNDQQLAQSLQMLNIIDSAQNIGEQAPPTVTQAAPTSYHSLNTAPISKVVDYFNLTKELEPGFKNSTGLESITIQAATANIVSLKTRLANATTKAEHYEKQCGEYKEKFDALVEMLASTTITAESLNKAMGIMAVARAAGVEVEMEGEDEDEMEVSSGDESEGSSEGSSEGERAEEGEEVFNQW